MTTRKESDAAADGGNDVAAQAADRMLGPNPFVGVRPQEILRTVGKIGAQAVRQPMLVLEQEAALARQLIAVLSGATVVEPAARDKRFADTAWTHNPFYRMYLQGYLAWGRALNDFVDRSR